MRTLAIIPAKGKSEGLPGKNLAMLGDKPLIVHTIEDVLASKLIDKLVVSTEDEVIGETSQKAGADVIYRPEWMCQPHSRAEEAVEHVLYALEAIGERYDTVMLLQCTSPFRQPGDLDNALALFEMSQVNSLFSACEIKQFLWRKDAPNQFVRLMDDMRTRPMRQQKNPAIAENGSFWITKASIYKNFHCRLMDKVGIYLQPKWCGIEIDTEEDLRVCRILMPWLTQSKLI
jgi:CMP-N,N'-diacetyllegionaminic acid synthase